jgi:hypothetical protein
MKRIESMVRGGVVAGMVAVSTVLVLTMPGEAASTPPTLSIQRAAVQNRTGKHGALCTLSATFIVALTEQTRAGRCWPARDRETATCS